MRRERAGPREFIGEGGSENSRSVRAPLLLELICWADLVSPRNMHANAATKRAELPAAVRATIKCTTC